MRRDAIHRVLPAVEYGHPDAMMNFNDQNRQESVMLSAAKHDRLLPVLIENVHNRVPTHFYLLENG
jgi:hypothetical protein